jgi:two-component sensor histidine kinase
VLRRLRWYSRLFRRLCDGDRELSLAASCQSWCGQVTDGAHGGFALNDVSSISPVDEDQRLAAVRRYDVLDTPPDGAFDRITAIAARRFDVPIAIISIVDEDRIWFKSHHGVEVDQIGRDPGLCASAILTNEPHILPDATQDPRSLANPLVAGEFGLRFYVGVPLRTSDGYNLGTLCVIDKKPRPVDEDAVKDLGDLASVVIDQLELRLAARRALAHSELMAREIDHRVMNSLQFVSGMLNMQSRSPQTDDVATELTIAANRVAAVARVHHHFLAGDAEQMSCLTFLGLLCDDLANILAREIVVEGDEGSVPTTLIQPIGLIVNELVTNCAKHGEGKIGVRYDIAGNLHQLTVHDEGPGVPSDFDPDQSTGLGLKVITTLTRQLNGRLTVAPTRDGKGSGWQIAFPVA